MIRYVKFKNFYSFKDDQIIDFTVSKKKSSDYYEAYDGVQISKVAGFAGPNASGKTNAMRIFGFISFVLCAAERKDSNFTPFKTYSFCNDKVSDVSIQFETDDYLYEYCLQMQSSQVRKENLKYKELKKGSRFTELYDRNEDQIELNPRVFGGVTKKVISKIPDDVSVCAYLNANYDVDILEDVVKYFSFLYINIAESGDVFSGDEGVSTALATYTDYPEIKQNMEELLEDFDIGIDKFIFHKHDEGYVIEVNHVVDKKSYQLPFHYESRGTRALFCEIGRILHFFDHGRLLVSDEIETGLHPEAVNKIVNFVVEKLSDMKKQFIFSSHSLEFMKKFDAQQIFLVEKDSCCSEIFRLDEIKLRSDDNYYSKYLSGAYGAFPKIRI